MSETESHNINFDFYFIFLHELERVFDFILSLKNSYFDLFSWEMLKFDEKTNELTS
jgi:hypothetical protein